MTDAGYRVAVQRRLERKESLLPIVRSGSAPVVRALPSDYGVRTNRRWGIEAEGHAMPRCPSCGTVSARQHSWYQRSLCDLPMQGVAVVIRLRVRKWRCEASACERSIFAEQLPGLASPHAHQSDVIADILATMGHSAGGETGRLLPAIANMAVAGLRMWERRRPHLRG